jgi:hypothetical protein
MKDAYEVLVSMVIISSIGLALIPAEDEPNPIRAVVKVAGLTLALVSAGTIVYLLGKRRRA